MLRGFAVSLKESLAHPLVPVIMVVMAAVAITTFMVMLRSQRLIIEHEAVKIAEVVARQALAARSVYTTAVADKLTRDGFGPDIDHEHKRGFVPLPAQFLKLIGREAAAHSDGLYRYRPLSKWNLDPSQGLRDEFQRWAWSELERQDRADPGEPIPWRAVWRFETIDGTRTLRYMRADPASSPSCVECHNRYERRPQTVALRTAAGLPTGKQWKLHQLLGAIEVHVPIEQVEAIAVGQARQTLGFVVAISLLGLTVVAWFTFQDIRRKQLLAARFQRQARFDALTELANRTEFGDQAPQALARAARDGRPVALLFLDLDNFKRINDSLGHDVGDRVIREVALRLRRSLREVDLLARHSGDEFTVLLHGAGGTHDFAQVAGKLLEVVTEPVVVDGHKLRLTASVGIACYPRDGRDVESLVKNADLAMYRAKEQGRDNYRFYSKDMDSRALETLFLGNELQRAVTQGELRLYYQPRVDAGSGTVVAVEAMLRWRHKELGLLEPARFLRIAEDGGAIEAMGRWVLAEVCAQARRWDAAGVPPVRVSANLSVRQLRALDFVDSVRATLREHGLAPGRLELEITEGVLAQQPQAAEIVLARLHDLGVKLAIDNFGTGYSSLSHLKGFALDYLKIDRSFIAGLPEDANNRALCDAVIALGRSLHVKVVAEGVETAAQRAFLSQHGCDELQGFLFARPAPAEEIEPLLRRGRVSG